MRRVFVRTAFSVICAFVLAVSVSATRALIPVGEVVGIELTDGSVSVAAFDDATGAASREIRSYRWMTKRSGAHRMCAMRWSGRTEWWN